MTSIDGTYNTTDVERWFKDYGFKKIEFKKQKEFITTYWLDQSVSYKLTQVVHFDTYYKTAFGGALLVFECRVMNDTIVYNCYAPIWLFGVWSISLKFKEKPIAILKYLKEGYKAKEAFEDYLNKNKYTLLSKDEKY